MTPRLLMLAPMPSHPANQGNRARLRAMAAALQARGIGAELLLHTQEDGDHDAMRSCWQDLHIHRAAPPPRPGLASAWGIDDWCPASLVQMVAALHARRRYHAVIVHYAWLSAVLPGLRDTLRVIDTHDIFGGRQQDFAAQGMAPRWYFTTPAEEARGLDRADLVLAIQPEEAALLAARTRALVMVLGHPVPPDFLRRAPATAVLAPFGWMGSGNPHNQAGLLALDAALAEAPALPWLVAGSLLANPPRLLSHPLLLGELADAAAFHASTSCVLNPMPGGTGLKIKTIEALMAGLPVIGTRGAFAGLGATHPAQQLGDIPAMLPCMRRFLAEPGYAAELRHASRLLALRYAAEVEEQYDRFAAILQQPARLHD